MSLSCSEYLNIYRDLCDKHGVLLLKPFVDSLQSFSLQGLGLPSCLNLRGSRPEMVNERIDDLQLYMIVTSASDAEFITRLDLSYNRITNDGAQVLANFLKKSKLLAELIIVGNDISDNGAAAFANALVHNDSLVYLNLSTNNIGSGEGVMAIAGMLQINRSIRKLWLNRCSISSAAMVALLMVAGENLNDLAIGANDVTDVLNHVGRMFERDCSVERLVMSLMKIDDEIMREHIGPYLRYTILSELDLRNNRIMGDGALAVAEYLEQSQTLVSLLLDHNSVGDRGAVALAKALAKNHSLRSLGLDANSVGEEGLVALADVVAKKYLHGVDYSLVERLGLWGNSFGQRACRVWCDVILRHRCPLHCNFRVCEVDNNYYVAYVDTDVAEHDSLLQHE